MLASVAQTSRGGSGVSTKRGDGKSAASSTILLLPGLCPLKRLRHIPTQIPGVFQACRDADQ